MVTEYGTEGLKRFHDKHGLRPDWHEPDEQDVYAEVVGSQLDNAMGDHPWVVSDWNTGIPYVGELVVRVMHRHYFDDGSWEVDHQVFANLASLLAAAAAQVAIQHPELVQKEAQP